MIRDRDTIAAPATAAGGAIAVIRVSGTDALAVCDRIFRARAPLAQAAGYSVHFGRIADGERFVDEALATVFRAPRSYTGEDSVELSCHGSPFIVSEVLRLLAAAGARMAEPGEFTVRAYLAGKLDLAQAEAVADLIASSSRAAHALAANQLRGGFSQALERLRERLLELVTLLELELDFSEEDVEFADRKRLRETMEKIGREITTLRESFALGNAIREGVPVVIAGAPNVGKSTLLNRLLGEERALVSEIAGTTRDVIEECVNIDGVLFRFLDTAGIRSTEDRLERMGIARTMESIARARIVIRMVDAEQVAMSGPDVFGPDGWFRGCGRSVETDAEVPGMPGVGRSVGLDGCGGSGGSGGRSVATNAEVPGIDASVDRDGCGSSGGRSVETDATAADLLAFNSSRADVPKIDAAVAAESSTPTADQPGDGASAGAASGYNSTGEGGGLCPDASGKLELRADQTMLTVVNKVDIHPGLTLPPDTLAISARTGEGIDALRRALRTAVDTEALYHGDAVVSSSRHREALDEAHEALRNALIGLSEQRTADLLSEDIRSVIHHLGTITARGAIAPDEVLGNIFSKFCIGK